MRLPPFLDLALAAVFSGAVLLVVLVFAAIDPSQRVLSWLFVGVVALLFLIDVLDHWSMIIVIPVLSIGAYLASVWVTKTFVEPSDLDSA